MMVNVQYSEHSLQRMSVYPILRCSIIPMPKE